MSASPADKAAAGGPVEFVSLKKKLLAFSIIFSLLLTVIISAVEITDYISTKRSEALSQLDHAEVTILPYIAERMWLLDYPSVENVLKTYLDTSALTQATVFDLRGSRIVELGSLSADRAIFREFPVTHVYNGRPVAIGRLVLSATIPHPVGVIKMRWGPISLMNGLLVGVVFILSYLLLHRTVLSHLTRINTYLDTVDPTSDDFMELAPPAKRHTRDEIFTVQNSINGLMHRIRSEFVSRVKVESDLASRNKELQRQVEIRNRIAEALRHSEQRYRLLFERSGHGVFLLDKKRKVIVRANKSAEALTGRSSDELQNLLFAELLDHNSGQLISTGGGEGSSFIDYGEMQIIQPTGTRRTVLYSEVAIDEQLVFGMAYDVTARKLVEEERNVLQQQLIQAQKMESVGRLAGGVAHDFNNMLGVILGNVELCLEDIPTGHPAHLQLVEIEQATNRSIELTRQLLAFARRQAVEPVVVDLNEKISALLTMLRRLIGEDIELTWSLGHDLWPVRIDPSQVDQILTNLCVNARDAMQGGGRLTIETVNVTIGHDFCLNHPDMVPGRYVCLSVRDDGGGIAPEHLEHLFEPFFTTKHLGEGTGLGLAMVYGIVRQNNGGIDVASTPGQGATFRIYLPQHQGDQQQDGDGDLPTGEEVGELRVLLVEDEEAILNMTGRMLEKMGHTVLPCNSPERALELVRTESGPIDLLLTDVIMPRINGRQLAEEVVRLRPTTRVIYMSGYTANVIAQHGLLERGVNFLQKPFGRRQLHTRISQLFAHQPAAVAPDPGSD